MEKHPKVEKNSALILRGKSCLSKSALFLVYYLLCLLWNHQVCSQPACLYFMMQLQNVICHTYQMPFYIHILPATHHKSSEVHIFLNHGKYTFCLDRTVYTKQDVKDFDTFNRFTLSSRGVLSVFFCRIHFSFTGQSLQPAHS